MCTEQFSCLRITCVRYTFLIRLSLGQEKKETAQDMILLHLYGLLWARLSCIRQDSFREGRESRKRIREGNQGKWRKQWRREGRIRHRMNVHREYNIHRHLFFCREVVLPWRLPFFTSFHLVSYWQSWQRRSLPGLNHYHLPHHLDPRVVNIRRVWLPGFPLHQVWGKTCWNECESSLLLLLFSLRIRCEILRKIATEEALLTFPILLHHSLIYNQDGGKGNTLITRTTKNQDLTFSQQLIQEDPVVSVTPVTQSFSWLNQDKKQKEISQIQSSKRNVMQITSDLFLLWFMVLNMLHFFHDWLIAHQLSLSLVSLILN